MQPSSPKKIDIIGFVLGLFFFCGLIGQAVITRFVSIHSSIYHIAQLIWISFLGLYLLSTGITKLRQRKVKQERVHWYNQPNILLAIGVFFVLPYDIAVIVVGDALFNNVSLALTLILFGPSLLCILASAFFAIRRFLGYQRSKV